VYRVDAADDENVIIPLWSCLTEARIIAWECIAGDLLSLGIRPTG
jgi:hypothetical protein